MSTSKARARKHLNKAEFELYSSLEKGRIGSLTEYRLKQKDSRLKRLRSKYATQKRTQKRDLKAKGFDASAENNRKIKLSLIDEMLKNVDMAKKKLKAASKKKVVKKKVVKKKTSKKTTKK